MLYIFARLHHAWETQPQFQEEAFIIGTPRIEPAPCTRGSTAELRGAGEEGGRGGDGRHLAPLSLGRNWQTGVIRGALLQWIAYKVVKARSACHGSHKTRDPGKGQSILPTPAKTAQRGRRWWVAEPLSGTAVLPVSSGNSTWASRVPKPTQWLSPLYSHCPKVRSDFEPADTELDWILPEIKMFSLLKSRLSPLSVNSGRSLCETYSFHAKSCSHSNFQGFSPVNRKNPVCVHVNMLETDYCMTLK